VPRSPGLATGTAPCKARPLGTNENLAVFDRPTLICNKFCLDLPRSIPGTVLAYRGAAALVQARRGFHRGSRRNIRAVSEIAAVAPEVCRRASPVRRGQHRISQQGKDGIARPSRLDSTCRDRRWKPFQHASQIVESTRNLNPAVILCSRALVIPLIGAGYVV
jgi:hypothetical protein